MTVIQWLDQSINQSGFHSLTPADTNNQSKYYHHITQVLIARQHMELADNLLFEGEKVLYQF